MMWKSRRESYEPPKDATSGTQTWKMIESILLALLKNGKSNNKSQCRKDMTALVNEMIRYGIHPTPNEFELLAECNLAECRFWEAKYWASKIAKVGQMIRVCMTFSSYHLALCIRGEATCHSPATCNIE